MNPATRAEVVRRERGMSRSDRFRWPADRRSVLMVRFPVSSDGLRLWWQQQAPREGQVRQGKHGQRSYRVLVEPTVAHLAEAPQPLHHVEGMLTARPLPRAGAIDRLLALGQGASRLGPPVDAVGNPGLSAVLPVILRPVRLVAEELPFLPVQKLVQAGDVALGGRTAHYAMHQPAAVGAHMQFHPEVPLL